MGGTKREITGNLREIRETKASNNKELVRENGEKMENDDRKLQK